MAYTLPQPDVSRFSPIAPELLLQAYLACTKQGVSWANLKRRLKAFVSADKVEEATRTLIKTGEAAFDGTVVRLTAKGKTSAKRLLGWDAGEKWDTIKAKRLPLLSLGLEPDDPDTRRRFSNADSIKAGAIAVAFDLPRETMASLTVVCSELVWRMLRAALPEIVGKGPFPAIDQSNAVDQTLLAGLARVRAKNKTEVKDGLAARAVGLEKANTDTVRRRLIVLGVARHESAIKAIPSEALNGTFAENVKRVARTLSTPPFQGRVAIAQIYDAYGRVYGDAGSLASFKQRLVVAARNRLLDLSRLDLPERMDRELRMRSETPSDGDRVHFVVLEWK